MKPTFATAGLAVVIATTCATAAFAASKEDKKVMKLLAECTYVVKMAEGNGVQLRNSSGQWEQATANFALQTKQDAKRHMEEARLKYKKRERVMGSGDAVRAMIQRARDCDAQL